MVQALHRRGYTVRVAIVPGATHQTIYSASVIAPLVTAWLHALVRPDGAHDGGFRSRGSAGSQMS